MKIDRLTNCSSSPLYQVTAENNEELAQIMSVSVDSIADLCCYNYGAVVHQWNDDGVTLKIYKD